ncbi:hypothetical protein B296_00040870, partial [Ensete ventricosum]
MTSLSLQRSCLTGLPSFASNQSHLLEAFGYLAVAGGRSENHTPMYKSRLQQLCQQRQWPLPEYAVSREGRDHDPHFRATVTVNGAAFHSPDDSRTTKEAQNKAAQVALEQLPETAPPP